MACHLFGTMPLPEPIMKHCETNSYEQTNFNEIWIRIQIFLIEKMHLKKLSVGVSHFVQASMCKIPPRLSDRAHVIYDINAI